MDAAGAGALIGIGFLVIGYLVVKIYDYYSNRHKKPPLVVTTHTPLLHIPKVQAHFKMNSLLPAKPAQKSVRFVNLH